MSLLTPAANARASFTPALARRRSVLVGLLAVIAALLFIAQIDWRPAALAIEMEVRTDQAARLLIPYRIGGIEKGYGVHMVESIDGYKTVRVPIDEPIIEGFRIVQVDGDATVWLRNVRVARFGGKAVPVPPARLRAGAGIAALIQNGDTTEVRPQPGTIGTELSVKLRKAVERKRIALRLDWLLIAALGAVCISAAWIARPSADELPGPDRTTRRDISRWIVGSLTAAYLIASLLNLNGSSSSAWRFYADRHDPDDALLVGSTKHIRSDEWVVQTPWILSQAQQVPANPIINRAVGDGVAPLITSLPVAHWTMVFRPQFLGFFVLPIEQAFAFYWNFKWYVLLTGSFLFLNLVAFGRSLIALCGSCFIFFSGFIQWWFSTPTMMPEMVGSFFLALWAGAMIFRARSTAVAAGASMLLVLAIGQFVFCCYPRFQIPLFYLGLFIAIAVAWQTRPRLLSARGALLASALAASGIVLWIWIGEVRPLLHEIGSLVYPGRVFSTGGTMEWLWHAAAFLEFGMTEHHFPKSLGNSCEASGFLFILPVLIAIAVHEALHRRYDLLLIVPVVFLALLVWFMSAGVPAWIARVTGFWAVSSTRANLAVGVGSAIVLVRWLAQRASNVRRPATALARSFLFVAISAVVWAALNPANAKIGDFVSVSSIVAASLFFGLLFLFIWLRAVVPTGVLLLVPLVYAHGLTNPISRGLPGFSESELLHTIHTARQTDPDSKWLVLGRSARSKLIPQIAKATGAEIVGGVRINPDRQMIAVLDPEGKYTEIYSRYAEIMFAPSKEPEPTFELTSLATYTVHLPVSGDWIDRLGIRYVLAVDLPEDETVIAGFEQIASYRGSRVLRASTLSH